MKLLNTEGMLPSWYPVHFDNPMTMVVESVAIDGRLNTVYLEDADSLEGIEVRLEYFLSLFLNGDLVTDIRCYHLN